MEVKELSKFIDDNTKTYEKMRSISELDRIQIRDIGKIEPYSYQVQDGEETKTVNRFKLTIKGEPIECPRSVMTQLNALIKKYGDKIVSFSVLKSGSGINTVYNIVPEMTV